MFSSRLYEAIEKTNWMMSRFKNGDVQRDWDSDLFDGDLRLLASATLELYEAANDERIRLARNTVAQDQVKDTRTQQGQEDAEDIDMDRR